MDLQSYSDLRKLLRAAISFRGRTDLAGYIHAQPEVPNWDMFLFAMPELRSRYRQALVALHSELVPNYISYQDLYTTLWNLFREIALAPSQYQSKAELDSRIEEFSRIVKKPLQTLDVLYEIKNLDIGAAKFNLGDAEVFKVTSEYLENLDFQASGSATEKMLFDDWVGRSVAKVEVNVSDRDRAREAGNATVGTVLDVIKLAAVAQRLSRLDDEMFLWELGKSIVIPRVRPQEGTLLSTQLHREFLPLVVPMGNSIQEGLETRPTWKHVLGGNLPEDVRVRVVRAIKWISHAVSSSSLDLKLVDLCTALEIMLLPNHKKGTKGELIAVRQALVGQGAYRDPVWVLNRYNQRSDIIHGGFLEITDFLDYWHLLSCCLEVLRNLVNLSKQHPDITTLEDLIGAVETANNLRVFIRRCEHDILGGRKGVGDIKRVAEKRLAAIERS